MSPEQLDQLTIALDPASQKMLAAGIVIMMFAIALGLRAEHFSFLRSQPKLVLGGLAAQLIALPAMTLLLIIILTPPPSIALGMMVVAACPGGNVSNFMSWIARGDVAYSVSLTAASSIIAAIWTPAAILLWSGLYAPTSDLLESIAFQRDAFLLQTGFILAAPLAAGMTIAHWRPRLSEKLRKPLAMLGASLLLIVIVSGTAEMLPVLAPAWLIILVPVVLHNGLAFAVGAAAGRALGASPSRRRALTFEVGIQNAGLAVVLLLSQLKGLGGAAAIAAVWGVWHFVSGGLMISFFRYLDRQGRENEL